MRRKLVFVVAVLVGGLLGGEGAWVFHYVLNVDVQYLGQHPWLVGTFGLATFLMIANAAFGFKNANPRLYGLFVLGIGAGIFLQATSYLPVQCTDSCHTNLIVKLGACLLLMVDGFGSFYRGSAKQNT